MRRIVAVVIAVAVAGSGCGSDDADFCSALEDRFDLASLQRALNADDNAAVTKALADLQDLKDLAPPEIREDLTKLIDATIDTVRAVSGATGPNGEKMPVDTSALSTALGEVAVPAQHVSDFADRTCKIRLGGSGQ